MVVRSAPRPARAALPAPSPHLSRLLDPKSPPPSLRALGASGHEAARSLARGRSNMHCIGGGRGGGGGGGGGGIRRGIVTGTVQPPRD